MSSPSTDATETTGPWEGGFSGLPDLGGGAVAIASERPEAGTGSLISYSGGVFEMRFWTDGPPVPQIIEILPPEALKPIRDQLAAQLQGPGSGLDDIPLRAFLETVRLYLSPDSSDRFNTAVFGSIAEPNPGEYLGQVSWPGDVVGTVQASADGILAQTHLVHLDAGNLVPLRKADIRSLVRALQAATVNSQWQQVLSFAEQAVLPAEETGKRKVNPTKPVSRQPLFR